MSNFTLPVILSIVVMMAWILKALAGLFAARDLRARLRLLRSTFDADVAPLLRRLASTQWQRDPHEAKELAAHSKVLVAEMEGCGELPTAKILMRLLEECRRPLHGREVPRASDVKAEVERVLMPVEEALSRCENRAPTFALLFTYVGLVLGAVSLAQGEGTQKLFMAFGTGMAASVLGLVAHLTAGAAWEKILQPEQVVLEEHGTMMLGLARSVFDSSPPSLLVNRPRHLESNGLPAGRRQEGGTSGGTPRAQTEAVARQTEDAKCRAATASPRTVPGDGWPG